MIKNKITLFGVFLVLTISLSYPVHAQIDLHAFLDKEVYFLEDLIELNVELNNLGDGGMDGTLLIEFKTSEGIGADIPTIEKQIRVPVNETYSETFNVPLVVGDYLARVLLKSADGQILHEENLAFIVYPEPISLNIRTCKDEGCEKVSSSFLPGENIILSINADGWVPIDARCITPEGDTFEVIFLDTKAKIVSDRIGEHTLIITATKEGRIVEETIFFSVGKEKTKDYWIYLLALGIIVLVIGMVILIRYFVKRKGTAPSSKYPSSGRRSRPGRIEDRASAASIVPKKK